VQIVAAIGLAAITDLTTYSRGANSCQSVTRAFMGIGPDENPKSYRQASPAQSAVRVPVRLLRGADDGIVGPEQVIAMRNARSMELAGAGHFDWVHPETGAYKHVLDTVFDVLSVSMQP
jgi:pimeloyl-ACP methyl ester carboxylesterase